MVINPKVGFEIPIIKISVIQGGIANNDRVHVDSKKTDMTARSRSTNHGDLPQRKKRCASWMTAPVTGISGLQPKGPDVVMGIKHAIGAFSSVSAKPIGWLESATDSVSWRDQPMVVADSVSSVIAVLNGDGLTQVKFDAAQNDDRHVKDHEGGLSDQRAGSKTTACNPALIGYCQRWYVSVESAKLATTLGLTPNASASKRLRAIHGLEKK